MSEVAFALQTVSGGTEELWKQMFTARPALTSLRCTGVQGVEFTDGVLQTVAEHCRKLQHFAFRAAPTLTDAGIMQLAQRCRKLIHLDVEGGVCLTDAALYALAEHTKELKWLAVRACAGFSEAAMLHLLHSCTKLKSLVVPSACVSKEAVAEMQKALLPRNVHILCRQ
jgi:hypothetical protein